MLWGKMTVRSLSLGSNLWHRRRVSLMNSMISELDQLSMCMCLNVFVRHTTMLLWRMQLHYLAMINITCRAREHEHETDLSLSLSPFLAHIGLSQIVAHSVHFDMASMMIIIIVLSAACPQFQYNIGSMFSVRANHPGNELIDGELSNHP